MCTTLQYYNKHAGCKVIILKERRLNMNLEPLYELKERLESSIIAGVSLLSEDFRLARAVRNMEVLAGLAPVFNKIFQAANELLSDECTNKADALLDTLALTDAVLKTQAVVSVEGEIKPLEAAEGTACTDTPYSVLAPILEALSSQGTGYYGFIMDEHKMNPGIFSDYRIKPALVEGLGAAYAELANHIEEWLYEEDASLIPLLKRGFDPKGKKEMVRRVHVIENIAKAAENQWYLSMLEDAEKDIRVALIYALRHDSGNQEILMGFVKTEKGNCKKAALWALADMKETDNLEFWETQLKKSTVTAAKPLILSKSDVISGLVAGTIDRQIDKMQVQAGSGSFILSSQDYSKINILLLAMTGKASAEMLELYRKLAGFKQFGQMKTEKNEYIQFAVQDILVDSMLWNRDKRLFTLAWELYRDNGTEFLKPALVAALIEKDGEEVYNTFAGMLEGEESRRKQVLISVMDVFSSVVWNSERQEYEILKYYYDEFRDKPVTVHTRLFDKPDIRWFVLFTDSSNITEGCMHTYYSLQYGLREFIVHGWDDVLGNMVCPQDKGICDILGGYFYQQAMLSAKYGVKANVPKTSETYYILMDKCGFKDGRGLVLAEVQSGKCWFYRVEDMILSAPMTVQDKMKELEEIKKLQEDGIAKIKGWSNEKYEDLYTMLVKKEMEE